MVDEGSEKSPIVSLCEVAIQRGLSCVPPKPGEKLGIARNVRDGIVPINGLRHRPSAGTCGWYIWAGEVFSSAPDFFVPLHVEHVPEWCPEVLRFLGLPPGWRFLVAGDYVDVWEDLSLLEHKG